jgi:hypothetical protein
MRVRGWFIYLQPEIVWPLFFENEKKAREGVGRHISGIFTQNSELLAVRPRITALKKISVQSFQLFLMFGDVDALPFSD